jgi:hypothetical protein
VGIDRPDDDDTHILATRSDRIEADQIHAHETDAGENPAATPAPDFIPDADRVKYHAEYRATVDATYMAAARERWEAAKPGFEEEWRQYAEQHPASPDAPLNIDQEAYAQVEQGCKGIRETEENVVTPAMVRIEAEDPQRSLVGLDFRRKGQDRIMEKVAAALEEQPDLSPGDALASVKDAIRYTFQYSEQHYAEGVHADRERLKGAGFELVDLRNSWGSEGYKGINSRWCVPESGQLFEVQFHTQVSFEAKQLTHQAYERIRSPSTTKAEQDVLADFQRSVNSYVPEPQRARELPNFP